MAAVRATREATVKHGGETLPVIIGTPIDGETIGGETFDGETDTAVFPGDLPADPDAIFRCPTRPPRMTRRRSVSCASVRPARAHAPRA